MRLSTRMPALPILASRGDRLDCRAVDAKHNVDVAARRPGVWAFFVPVGHQRRRLGSLEPGASRSEAGGVAGGEQLLRVRAGPARAAQLHGHLETEFDPAVGGGDPSSAPSFCGRRSGVEALRDHARASASLALARRRSTTGAAQIEASKRMSSGIVWRILVTGSMPGSATETATSTTTPVLRLRRSLAALRTPSRTRPSRKTGSSKRALEQATRRSVPDHVGGSAPDRLLHACLTLDHVPAWVPSRLDSLGDRQLIHAGYTARGWMLVPTFRVTRPASFPWRPNSRPGVESFVAACLAQRTLRESTSAPPAGRARSAERRSPARP